MRKILIALAMLMAALAPVALTATPAHAYTCVSKYKVASVDVVTPNGIPAGQWEDTIRLNYRVCNEPNTTVCDSTHCYNLFSTTAYAEDYTIWHDHKSGSCNDVDSWAWNPNAIGNVDLVTKTRGCYTTIDQTLEWDFADQRITQGMSDAESCLGTTLTKVREPGTDPTQSFPSLCVTFTM